MEGRGGMKWLIYRCRLCGEDEVIEERPLRVCGPNEAHIGLGPPKHKCHDGRVGLLEHLGYDRETTSRTASE